MVTESPHVQSNTVQQTHRLTVGVFHQCSSRRDFSWHLYHRAALSQHHYLVATDHTKKVCHKSIYHCIFLYLNIHTPLNLYVLSSMLLLVSFLDSMKILNDCNGQVNG